MMVKQVVLWAVALLAASAENMVDFSKKTLANIPSNQSVNITSLILHHNQITMNSSDIQALRNYSNLTKLDLSYNLISELPDKAFSALSSLETLLLKGNKLQTISKETFTGLKKLKTLDLAENPWTCTQELLTLMNGLRQQIGCDSLRGEDLQKHFTCTGPNAQINLAGKGILDVLKTSTTKQPPVTTITATTTKSAFTSTSTSVTTSSKTFITVQSPPHQELTTVSRRNISNKDNEAKQNGHKVTNTWKFLTGVIVIILCTSMVIVCAVKSPTWYKMLFDYRHQRLCEAEEPSIFNTGRYSNYSLDTEQTETSAHELDQGLAGTLEDEDGFIEDGYIQPEDYKEQADVDEM